MKERIKVYLYNKTMKEIDMSDFSYISEDVFSERTDIVKVVLPEGVKEIAFQAFFVTGLLSFLYSSEVHQIVSLVVSSITKNLSLGERPV